MKRKKHSSSSRTRLGRGLLILLVFALLLSAALVLLHRYEKAVYTQPVQPPDLAYGADAQYMLTYDGKEYIHRSGLTTVLLMGIDAGSSKTLASPYRNGGQADFIQLLVIDHTYRQLTRIPIDRDTMTEIQILGVTGRPAGKRVSQLALSHGFGDGREQSCELTKAAVENYLLDIHIDYYLALDLQGIVLLNDLLGGVTVTLTDDFSSLDPQMQSGSTLTLRGAQAEIFVRSRMELADDTNERRMARQEVFLSSAGDLLTQKLQSDERYALTLLDSLGEHLVSNMTREQLASVSYRASQYASAEPVVIPGVHAESSAGFMEFFPDTQAAHQAILQLMFVQQPSP